MIYLFVSKQVLKELFEGYIEATSEKSVVENKTVLLCRLTNSVLNALGTVETKAYVTNRMLKHLFDSKPAEEFHFIVDHVHKVVKFPDRIYRNKNGKRGCFCFVKRVKNDEYLCSLEIVNEEKSVDISTNVLGGVYVVTAFRLRKPQYLNSYELVWSWKGDNPSS